MDRLTERTMRDIDNKKFIRLISGTAFLDYYRVFLTREEAETALEGGMKT